MSSETHLEPRADAAAAAAQGAAAAPDGTPDSGITWLRHNRIDLALHELRPASDPAQRPLLLLHGLGEESRRIGTLGVQWSGAVYGLDFTGHGRSTVPVGGGYTSEVLVGDVDAALTQLGPVTIIGRGLGAYIALMAAAARPDVVIGAVLADGPGIAGGGVQPGTPTLVFPAPLFAAPPGGAHVPDPFALVELARDVRPPDYAQSLLSLASGVSSLDRLFYVSAIARPEWLDAIVSQPGVQLGTIEEALVYFAAQQPPGAD